MISLTAEIAETAEKKLKPKVKKAEINEKF
jgi:hypothetical protein